MYTYVGSNRIVKVAHTASGSNNLTIAYSLGGSGVYSGMDRFGRTVQQLWKDGSLSGSNYDGYSYTYDRNGNIKTKDDFATGNAGNLDESYTYDGLDRLVEARRGTLSSGLQVHVASRPSSPCPWLRGNSSAQLVEDRLRERFPWASCPCHFLRPHRFK